MAASIDRIVLGPISTNCYIITDDAGCIVVDPAQDAPAIEERLGARKPDAIVLTHAHWDHTGALAQLAKDTGAPVCVYCDEVALLEDQRASGADGFNVTIEVPKIDRVLHDGDEIDAGGMRFLVLHTPGHTHGSICLYDAADKMLVSGDTLFFEAVGRTDFETGSDDEMLATMRDVIAPLPDDVAVYPGHGRSTTIAHERIANPYLSQP